MADAEFEIGKEPKNEAIDWLNKHLPEQFAFAIHSIKRDRRSSVFLAEFALDDVFPFITEELSYRNFQVGDISYKVKMDSLRYRTFKRSPRCVACGLKGDKFVLERDNGARKAHFNFYGNGVLMTRDHIIPKSLDGPETVENMQTCCTVCNFIKDSYNFSPEQIRELRLIYDQSRRGITKREFSKLFNKCRMFVNLFSEERK